MANLIQLLHDQNVTHIAHITDRENTSILHQAWRSAHQLTIPPHWHNLWEEYTQALSKAHIHISDDEDEIIWALSKFGRYTPKVGYLVLAESRKP